MKPFFLFLFAAAAPLHATTILIDFGPTDTIGQPVTWNNFKGTADGSSLSLHDTTGLPTDYSITLSGGNIDGGLGGYVNDNTTTGLTNSGAPYSPFTPSTVLQDNLFVWTSSGSRTFTLSGLDPAITYDLTFFSYVDRSGTRETHFSIPGHTTLSLEPALTTDSGGQVGIIPGVAPDEFGNIAITASSPVSGASWIISGLEINYTIPEPTTALLSIFGLIPLLLRRR